MKDVWPALALAAAAIVGLGIMSLSPPADARQVAAVFPPWLSMAERMERVTAARGVAVDEGAWGNVVLVSLPSGTGRGALLRQGAWFVVDPRALRGCFSAAAAAYAPGGEIAPGQPDSLGLARREG
ncbi:MAG: hypothetical protein RIB84_28095 [Sneathiellaceae bacterium]